MKAEAASGSGTGQARAAAHPAGGVAAPGPRAGAPAVFALPRQPPQELFATPARRVLVADGDVDAADRLTLLLRAEGCRVSVCYDGPAATKNVGAMARRHPQDIMRRKPAIGGVAGLQPSKAVGETKEE